MEDYGCGWALRRVSPGIRSNGEREGSCFHLVPVILNETHLRGINFVRMPEHHPPNSDLVDVGQGLGTCTP